MLIDTHILLWLVNQEPIPKAIAAELKSSSERFISVITAWEIFMLEKKKKIQLSLATGAWLARALAEHNIEKAPITVPICHRAMRLAWPHRDPADRFIIATALELGLPLATVDKQILDAGIVEVVN